jgi:hypothetical protein
MSDLTDPRAVRDALRKIEAEEAYMAKLTEEIRHIDKHTVRPEREPRERAPREPLEPFRFTLRGQKP